MLRFSSGFFLFITSRIPVCLHSYILLAREFICHGATITISVLSFVSWCSHLSCRSRCFDCLLLVFFRRWGRLVTQYHLYHAGGLWLVHFDPHCSGEKLFPQWSVVVPFSCCVSWSWASTLREFQFRYPCWCYQGEVLCDQLPWPIGCTSEDLDQ